MADNMTSAQRSYTMSRIRSTGNAATEQRFLQLLRRTGVVGWRRGISLPGRPDLVFRKQRVVVFLDGCFWHGCPRCYAPPKSNLDYWGAKISGNAARDKRMNAVLRSAGWRVVRIWQHDIRRNPSRALRKLTASLASPIGSARQSRQQGRQQGRFAAAKKVLLSRASAESPSS
jgi:DNA mismatch endonuclease (patch repair protein)